MKTLSFYHHPPSKNIKAKQIISDCLCYYVDQNPSLVNSAFSDFVVTRHREEKKMKNTTWFKILINYFIKLKGIK